MQAQSNRSKFTILFSILVLLLSLLNLSNQFLGGFTGNYASVIVSLIGITGCALTYLNHKNALTFLNIWSVAQVFFINVNDKPFWSVEQVLSFGLNLNFTLRSGTLIELGFNPFAIIFIYCVWKLKQMEADNNITAN